MKQPENNIEFVARMMNFSKYGALAQLFILDAIEKHAIRVSNADPKIFEHSLVNGEAWVGVAKEIKHKIETRP